MFDIYVMDDYEILMVTFSLTKAALKDNNVSLVDYWVNFKDNNNL